MKRTDHALVCALEALRIHQVHLAGRIAALEQQTADYELSPATIEGSAKAGRNVQRAISQLRELPDEAKQGSWLSELRHLDSIRKSLNALFLVSLLLYAWVALYPGLHHLHAEKPVGDVHANAEPDRRPEFPVLAQLPGAPAQPGRMDVVAVEAFAFPRRAGFVPPARLEHCHLGLDAVCHAGSPERTWASVPQAVAP